MNSEISKILISVSSELELVELSHYESHQHENYLHEEGEYIKRSDAEDIIKKHLIELCELKNTEIESCKKENFDNVEMASDTIKEKNVEITYLKNCIDSTINEFKRLHEKAETLRDKLYLDGVLAVLETKLSYNKDESTES